MDRRALIASVALVAGLALLRPSAGSAGSKFQWLPVTDADWAIAEDPAKGIRDAAIVFERIMEDDQDMLSNKCYYSEYTRIRILSDQGRKWADVLTDYLYKGIKVEDIKGRTILRDGSTVSLDPAQIFEKEVWRTEGIKVKQKSFSLPAVTRDCLVEYYIRYRLDDPYHVWLMQKDIYLAEGEFVWRFWRGKGLVGPVYKSALDSLAASYVSVQPDSQLKVERHPTSEDPVEFVFTIKDLPAFQSEPCSPPDIALKWQVRHFYTRSGASVDYWRGVSNDIAENVRKYSFWNDRVKELATSKMPSYGDPESKAVPACAWMNTNIRNGDLDDTGEKEEPNGCVSHVIEHGYGNGAEIAVTFHNLLHEMGIGAKLVLTVDRNQNYFMPEAKYSQQLTRWLVAVPTARGDYVFFRPGCDYLVPGQVDWFNEGSTAFVIGDSTKQFVTIPFSSAKANRSSEAIALKMGDDLHLTGSLAEECLGQAARWHRLRLRKATQADVTQYLKDDFATRFPTFKPDSFTVSGVADARWPLTIKCHVEADFAGQQLGSKLLLKPYDFFVRYSNLLVSDERKCDVWLNYAEETVDNLTIDLPEGWSIDVLPQDTTFANQVGECDLSFKTSGRTLSIVRDFTISKPIWEAAAYPDVKKLYQMQQALSEIAVVINRGGPR